MAKVEPNFEIRVEVYDTRIRVFLDQSRFKAFLESHGEDPPTSNSIAEFRAFRNQKDDESHWCIYVPGKLYRKRISEFMSAVSHESVHAAWHILDDRGVVVKASNHEALAYLVDFLVMRIMEGTKTWNKHRRR